MSKGPVVSWKRPAWRLRPACVILVTGMLRNFSAVVLLLLMNGCAEKNSPGQPPAASGLATSQTKSIGEARMEPDGTLVLQLRAEGPGKAIGDGLFRYPTNHQDYPSILRHIGKIKPGETKPVPPWKDAQP
jgi:hypothetical protein